MYRVGRPIRTVRDGGADEPITITGPSDAAIRPIQSVNRFSSLVRIRHNHVHLHGLSFDGLADSNRGDEIGQYKVKAVIRIRPPSDTSEYLEDIVVKPATVGNSYWGLINHKRANDVEIGEFKVAGIAGAGYVVTGDENRHAGEIVYLGTPPGAVLENVNPNWGIDESHDIHVHHIDNSEGHPHSEIVNTKLGTYDVRIEYCTDGGGSQHTDPYPVASINLQSYDATVRWCRLRDGDGHGVHVNSGAEGALESIEDPSLTREIAGTGHRIYGNEIRGFGADAIAYTMTTPEEQHTVCGNTFNGPTQGSPSGECPGDVPEGDGAGHLGGSSPWSQT